MTMASLLSTDVYLYQCIDTNIERIHLQYINYYNVMYCILHTHYYSKLHIMANIKDPFSHSCMVTLYP